MDELRIKSDEMKRLIAGIIKKSIRRKYGFDIELRFPDDIELTIDNAAHLSLSVEADISKHDLAVIRKNVIGL